MEPRQLGRHQEIIEVIPARAGEAPARIEYVDGGSEGSGGLLGLARYWYVLRRRKWIILSAGVLGAIIGVLLSLPQVPMFRAMTSIEIQAVNTGFMNLHSLEPTGSSMMGFDLPTEIAILSSNTMLKRVADKVMAQREKQYVSKPHKLWVWISSLGLPLGPSSSSWRQSVNTAWRKLEVRNMPGARVVSISTQSQNPKAAADFVNTLANEFIDEHLEARWKSAQRTGEWLGRQLEDLRKKLQDSEQALQDYARTAGLTFVDGQNTTSGAKLKQLRDDLFRAQSARMAQQSKYELIRSGSPEAILDVIEDPTLRSYQNKLSDLRQQMADASTAFTPAHFSVRRIQAQITEIEQGYEKVRASLLRRITNDYETARNQEKLLAAAYNNQLRIVSEDEQKTIRYNLMKREVDTNRQLYDSMLTKMKESSVASTMLASNVRVIDVAEVPTFAVAPNLVKQALIGFLAGLMLVSSVVVGLWHFDRSLKLPGDAENYLSLPELGVIPAARADPTIRKMKIRTKAPTSLGLGPALHDGQHQLELVTFQREPSLMAESYRSTLASLLFSSNGGPQPRVVAVTSASPLEGKSTIVSNLALALAEMRHRVLLIDADMRKPRLHTIYKIDNTEGLGKVLAGDEDLTAVPLDTLIHATAVPHLYLLPSGPPRRLTADLLTGKRMSELLRRCRKEFDWVLVDTPPAVQVVDARLIGRHVDGVILVLRAGRTNRELIRTVGKRLNDDGTRILGTVLNDWNPEEVASNYYADHLRHYEQV